VEFTGRCVVLTGVSRGLGAALLDQLIESGDHVVAIGRTFTAEQHRLAAAQPSRLRLHCADLGSRLIPGVDTFRTFFAAAGNRPVVLMHNAATISPLGTVGNLPPDDVAQAIAVNLTSVIMLTNSFLAARPPEAVARIVLVSSRAAEVAKVGQSIYTATKSGAERFLDGVALECAMDPRIQVFCVRAPAMDTGMQEDIRAAVALPDRDQFIGRYLRGELTDADEVASKIIADYLVF
jgi:benzil reductase ((S)-benzoin forming)